jgi:glucokinase
MKPSITIFKRNVNPSNYTSFILGGDIGGTNTRLAIAGNKNNKPEMLFSLIFPTPTNIIKALQYTINYAREEHNINIKRACLGVAGRVSSDRNNAKLTNANITLQTKNIFQKTKLKTFLINDFEAVAHGIHVLKKKDYTLIKKGTTKSGTRIVLGAGTGLGKAILPNNSLTPLPSEGGHSDLPMHTKNELKLVHYIHKQHKLKSPVSYEDVLSGRGITNIYTYLKAKYPRTKYTAIISKASNKQKPYLITKYMNDPACKATMQVFTQLTARCAKNFTLDTLATQVYLAGGIIAEHAKLFKSAIFKKEFENTHKQSQILKATPVYIITNTNVGLYGACFAAIQVS